MSRLVCELANQVLISSSRSQARTCDTFASLLVIVLVRIGWRWSLPAIIGSYAGALGVTSCAARGLLGS